MKQPKMATLILRDTEFVHIGLDGVETIVYTAASKEAAEAIADMLDKVRNGGFLRGRYVGYKKGLKTGIAVAGAAGVIAGYIAVKVWMAERRVKEEADAE